MQPAFEQCKAGCSIISLLTNLEVQVFDDKKISQLYYARYDLPAVLAQLKQNALVHILQQTLAREHIYIFRAPFQLEFLTAGVWRAEEYQGSIVVGPYISKAYHPQLLNEMGQKEQLPPVMQRQLQQYYNTLTMLDEAKQHAIGTLLMNIFLSDIKSVQMVETVLPLADEGEGKFTYELEQNRQLVEKRYEHENKLLHAITQGDIQQLKQAHEDLQGLPRPFRHPQAPVRSMKNLSLSHNTLARKAAENAGVHPLYLDGISGKFAIQIEQAQSLGELDALYEEMLYVYCTTVRDLAQAQYSPLIKEAVTTIRLRLNEPISLNDIADTLGVHPSYLARTFKKETGMTITDYIHKLRIDEAKYLLDQGNVSVSDAAFSVGYIDANYFSKVFTKREHMTPQEYRKRKREP